MAVELLERQKRFDGLIPQLVDAYSLLPASESAAVGPLETHELSPLFGQIHETLANQLPSLEVSQATTHDALARAMAKCSELLMLRQNEVHKFLRSLVYLAVEIRVRGEHHPEAISAALNSARKPLLEALEQRRVPMEEILAADLIAQPLEVVHQEVQRWLEVSSRSVADQLMVSLHTLVEMDVVGIIEWPGKRACKLNFFRHTIVQDRVRSQKTSTVRRVERNTLAFEEWERLRARNRLTIERHEHHVMNAELHELGQTDYPIPQKYMEFVAAIPDWLRPQIRVLEGELIREEIIERSSRAEQWESQPRLRSAYEIEPAIVLGHFVLAGWGQSEVERERSRRERAKAEESFQTSKPATNAEQEVRESANLQYMANLASVAAVVMMLFSPLQHRVMLPLSLLLSLVAVVTLGRSLRGDRRLNSVDVANQCLTRAFLLLAIQSALFGVLYGSFVIAVLALPLGIVARVTRRLSQSRRQD